MLTFAAALLVCALRPLRAQDEPVEAPPRAQPADNAAALAESARRDPVVAAAIDLPRETPRQQLRTISVLIDLGRNDVAALILPELLAAPLDDAQRADLVREFGPARFMQLIRLDRPDPDGAASPLAGARTFAQQALDAAALQARDPARLAQLIEQLNAPTAEARYAAKVDLQALGEPAIVQLTTALAQAPAGAGREHIMDALAGMRPAIDAAAVAVLAEDRGPARAAAADLAGRARIGAALPWLSAMAVSSADAAGVDASYAALARMGLSAPTIAEAQALLRTRLAEIEAMPQPSPYEPVDIWWSWDPARQQLTSAEYSPRQLCVLARARLARALEEAGGLANESDALRTLIDQLEESSLLARELSRDAAQRLAATSPAVLSAALAAALDSDRSAAAARLASELGARGDLSILTSHDGQPTPLARALQSPVRTVRFAALEAIMQLGPTSSFAGSSAVATSLWFFAAGAGDATAVAAAPVFTRASEWAGLLRGLGYDAVPVATGRDAVAAALDAAVAPRLAVVMIDGDIGLPLAREVVFQIRSSERTARVPIIIATSAERLADAQRMAAEDPLIVAAPRPHGEDALGDLVELAVAQSPEPLAENDERIAQAAKALDWLAKLLSVRAPYDELRRDGRLAIRAMYDPALSEPAIRAAGALGTADSQRALADLASSSTQTIDTRRAAAEALAASLARYGTQLTSHEILAQYDRYNASARADVDTQRVLGSILDAIERKTVE